LSECPPAYHRDLDALAGIDVDPVITGPSTGERNKIGAYVILAQDLKRLVRGRRAVVSELIDALLSCGHFESPRYPASVVFERAGFFLAGAGWSVASLAKRSAFSLAVFSRTARASDS